MFDFDAIVVCEPPTFYFMRITYSCVRSFLVRIRSNTYKIEQPMTNFTVKTGLQQYYQAVSGLHILNVIWSKEISRAKGGFAFSNSFSRLTIHGRT